MIGTAFLPTPASSFCTVSDIICAQFTGRSPVKAPNMVLPTVMVTCSGFKGYRIGIKKAKTCLSLRSLQASIS